MVVMGASSMTTIDVCYDCKDYALPGLTRCQKHLLLNRESAKRAKSKLNRRRLGLCWDCNESPLPGRTRCAKHLKRTNVNNKRCREGNGRYSHARGVAKQRGQPWGLTREDYIALLADPCAYCGHPIGVREGIGLDRIECSVGYEKGNVVPCCFVCNTAKGAFFTFDEMKQLGSVIAQIKDIRRSHEPFLE